MNVGVRRARRLALYAALLCAGCSGNGGFAYSGTLQSESANVGSTVGGRIVAVYVADGQAVHEGQVLVRLDDGELRGAWQSAVASQRQAAATLADLEAGSRPDEIARAEAQAAQAQAQLQEATQSQPHQLDVARDAVHSARASLAQSLATQRQQALAYSRARVLYSQGAIAAQDRDDARAAYLTSAAAVRAARAGLASAQAQLAQLQTAALPQGIAAAQSAYASAAANAALVAEGSRPDQVVAARAALAAAKANTAAAESRLREMTIRAPAGGVIDSLDLRAGDLIGPRGVVATVREFVDPYVRIYVAQKDLADVAVGRHVRVRSDALDGAIFDGRIEQIDQDAQFTPRDVQTTEDRLDLVFGVKIRVHDPERRLHGGTTVEVALP